MKKSVRYAIIAAIIVVIIGVSAFAAFLMNKASETADQQQDRPTPQEESPATREAEKKAADADKLAAGGNVTEGVATLDRAISETNDSHSKFLFYSQKAILLYNDKKLPEALVAAKAAFDAEQNDDAAAFVGQIAREIGDKATAIDYYKKAQALVDASGSPMAEKDKKYYASVVAELESGR
jgi:tetratricopeptide (TPR) repeat protein